MRGHRKDAGSQERRGVTSGSGGDQGRHSSLDPRRAEPRTQAARYIHRFSQETGRNRGSNLHISQTLRSHCGPQMPRERYIMPRYRTAGNASHRQLPFQSCPWPKRGLARFVRNDMIGAICGSGRHGFLLSQEWPSRISVPPYCKVFTSCLLGKKDRKKEEGRKRIEPKKTKEDEKKDKRATLSSPFSPLFVFFGYGGFGCGRRPRWVPPRSCDPRFSAYNLRSPASFVRFLCT